MTTKEKKIKEKYLKIKAEDLAGNYEVNINTDGTVSYKEEFIELDGRKYWCRKFGEDKWTYIRIKDFPFADFPKDFKKIRSFGDTLYDMNKISSNPND